MNKLDLETLLERVRNATGPSAVLDAELYATIGGAPNTATAGPRKVPLVLKGDPKDWPAYTASIDAAVALVDRVLPEWQYHMGTCGEDDIPWACITEPVEPCRDFAASAPEITIAILTALLCALTSNQEGNDEA